MGERALSALTNILIVNETSDNAIVTYSRGSAKKHDRKKEVRKAKRLGISVLWYNNLNNSMNWKIGDMQQTIL